MTDAFTECPGGITAAGGFRAGALHCGIRKAKKDLALITSEVPARVAGVFTRNRTQAACVTINKQQLSSSGMCSAVLINSGNANACTGERGWNDAWTTIRTVAGALAIPEAEVMISSTGVIGQYLPMDNVVPGIMKLADDVSRSGHADAAAAIMTTDTYPKEAAVQFSLGEASITLGAMAKGSGMIAPNMATMLAFLTTDAVIDRSALQEALTRANRQSFNRVTVDGDMSTNDMVLVLANGKAGNTEIKVNTEEFELFCAALTYVLIKLAKLIARDGEGATRLVEILVTEARTEEEAEVVARSVANSNLVKTAIHGADANWGRILAAVGYAGIDLNPELVEIAFNDVPVLGRDYAIVVDEAKAREALMKETVVVRIVLNRGAARARFWTCDLTKEYVHINASYRS